MSAAKTQTSGARSGTRTLDQGITEFPALPTELNGPGPDSTRGSPPRRTSAAADTAGATLAAEPDHGSVLLGQPHPDGRRRRGDGTQERRCRACLDRAAQVGGGLPGEDGEDPSEVVLAEMTVAGAERGTQLLAVLGVERVEQAPRPAGAPVPCDEARSRRRGWLSSRWRAFPGVIEANQVGMNGWAMIASPPASWMASIVSSTDMCMRICRSRKSPRMWIPGGNDAVTSSPRTTSTPSE